MNKTPKNFVRQLSRATPMLAAISRTQSFSAAAAKLGQTQSTVSHQIRALEDKLGYAVFQRTTRAVTPTQRGALICAAAQASVDALTEALERIELLGEGRDQVLAVSSSLAMKWLVPAMSRAQERGLRLSLQISDGLSEIGSSGEPQIAIRFGKGPYPGLHADMLAKCSAVAVKAKGTPGLTQATPDRPAQLLRDQRAETDGTAMIWEDYLQTGGLNDVPQETAASFDRSDLAIQAAIGGLGHALGRSLLVEGDLADGLLSVDGPALPLPARYWLVTTADHARTSSYAAVADWLKSEVARSQAALALHLDASRDSQD